MHDEIDQIEADLEQAALALAEGGSKKKNKKGPGTSRGIETLFRTAYDAQLGLTTLADTKANMLISVNGIIVSVIIAAVAPRLEDQPLYLIPAGILVLGAMIAIVFAILAVQPRIWREANKAGGHDGPENILFFGNFARRSELEFVDEMFELIEDRTRIYESMMRYIYGLGSVLRRKFVLLNIAYTSFLAGLTLGVISTAVLVIRTL